MRSAPLLLSAGFLAFMTTAAAAQPPERGLQQPSSFQSITDQSERSKALFNEAAKVFTHPRCLNCHPATERPLQGDDKRPHVPIVLRGEAGLGVPGNSCSACHTEKNFTLIEGASYRSIPGHPRWHLAPLEMAWEGKSNGEICQQVKDPARNGGKSLAQLHEHSAKDDLVAWGWDPGEGRQPAPGNQKIFGDLIQAWIDTGAQCP